MISWLGLASAAAAIGSVGTWTRNLFTEADSGQVLGLGEGGWRRLANPALVFAIAIWTLGKTIIPLFAITVGMGWLLSDVALARGRELGGPQPV